LEDFAHYVSKRKPAGRRVLLIVDEFSAVSTGGADAANLFERVRSHGAGVMVTSQSYEGLGKDAARLVGAVWATIAFQCTDPEPIAARAGTMKEVQTNLQAELSAVPGRNTLMSGKEYLSGTFMQHEQEVPRLHPNVIRSLAIGECCIITNGAYMEMRVARLPQIPDMGMVWGRAPQHIGGPPGRSQQFMRGEPAKALDLLRPEARPGVQVDGLNEGTDTDESGTEDTGAKVIQALDEPGAHAISPSIAVEELDI
jgi:hypothetical protein